MTSYEKMEEYCVDQIRMMFGDAAAEAWAGIIAVEAQGDISGTSADDSPASRSEAKAREVIGDLKAGRIWKGTVRDLGEAVRRAEVNAAAGNAIKGRGP